MIRLLHKASSLSTNQLNVTTAKISSQYTIQIARKMMLALYPIKVLQGILLDLIPNVVQWNIVFPHKRQIKDMGKKKYKKQNVILITHTHSTVFGHIIQIGNCARCTMNILPILAHIVHMFSQHDRHAKDEKKSRVLLTNVYSCQATNYTVNQFYIQNF